MKWFRLVIIFASTVFVSFLLHLAVYQFDFSIINISNALFVVGIILLLPSLIALTSAYKVFQGFGYSVRVFLSPQFRQKYPALSDYKNDKNKEIHSTIFVEFFVSSAVIVVIAVILALFWYV